MMNRKAKGDWEKKQAEEAEKLRKHNEVSTDQLIHRNHIIFLIMYGKQAFSILLASFTHSFLYKI